MQRGFFVVEVFKMNIGETVQIISGEKKRFTGKIVNANGNNVDVEIYNGDIITKHVDEVRVYILSPIDDFLSKFDKNEIIGMTTGDLFSNYNDYCTEHKDKPMDRCLFTKYVLDKFDLSAIDKKISGRKYKIFTKRVI